MDDYSLLDSGHGQKLERFGPQTIIRPASQAVYPPRLPKSDWDQAGSLFSREGKAGWRRNTLPKFWSIELEGIRFKLEPTDFGHLGIFPEQKEQWRWLQETISGKPVRVLNLFAYSGGSTLACAKAGANVCHLDASKGMVAWAKENAALSGLAKAPIRWIVDDALKFVSREVRRNQRYDGIILDPPSFGRGAKGEVFKLERDVPKLLELCQQLLSDTPLFMLLSCHTPGVTPSILGEMLGKDSEVGEMQLPAEKSAFSMPSGAFARWRT